MVQRVIDITDGIAMVVTDLHGEWPVYQMYRDIFFDLYHKGLAHHFILCGDFSHHEMESYDRTLDIWRDLYALETRYGKETIIVLCGNHEIPHIYFFPLIRSGVNCTIYTENALHALPVDEEISLRNFLASLPWFVRTHAGVMITHAGAHVASAEECNYKKLLHWDHESFLANTEKFIQEKGYENLIQELENNFMVCYRELSYEYFGVDDPQDQRYYLLIRSQQLQNDKNFSLLWKTFFSGNENEFGEKYYCESVLPRFLHTWSQEISVPQQYLVTGHISVQDGYQVLGNKQQLRIASYTHSDPRKAGCYLMLDCGKNYANIDSLQRGLKKLWPTM